MKYSLVGKTCKFHEMLMSYCLTSTWPSGVFFMNREKLFSSLPTTFSVFYSIWAPSPAPSCPLYFSEHLSPFRLAVQISMASHVSSHLISSHSLENSFLLAACPPATIPLLCWVISWVLGHIHSSLPSASSMILDGIGRDGSHSWNQEISRQERKEQVDNGNFSRILNILTFKYIFRLGLSNSSPRYIGIVTFKSK